MLLKLNTIRREVSIKYERIKQIVKGLRCKDTYMHLGTCDVLLIGHQHHYSYLWEGRLYSPILESHIKLESSNGLECKVILRPYSDIALSRASSHFYRYNRKAILFKLVERLESIFRKELSLHDRLYEEFWLNILSRTGVFRVAAIQPDKFICRAARRARIEVIDLQHGVVCQDHPWYGKKFNRDKTPVDLPTSFYVWDNESKRVIESWALAKGCDVKVIGNQWLARFLHDSDDDKVVAHAKADLPDVDYDHPVVLVSLQWGLRKYIENNDFDDVMIPIFRKLIEKYHDKYTFLVRLHPVQLYGSRWDDARSSLEKLSARICKNRFNWYESSFAALPALLSKSNVHLTYSSTVVKEAAEFGVPSAILDQDIRPGGSRSSYYEDLKFTGMVTIVEPSLDKIVNWIDSQLKKKNSRTL